MNKPKEDQFIDTENRVVVTGGEEAEGGRAKLVKVINCMVTEGN